VARRKLRISRDKERERESERERERERDDFRAILIFSRVFRLGRCRLGEDPEELTGREMAVSRDTLYVAGVASSFFSSRGERCNCAASWRGRTPRGLTRLRARAASTAVSKDPRGRRPQRSRRGLARRADVAVPRRHLRSKLHLTFQPRSTCSADAAESNRDNYRIS